MNIRSKCFYKQAAESGKGYKWWEYRSSMFNNCTMAQRTFTVECATKVRRFPLTTVRATNWKGAWTAASGWRLC